MKMQEIITAVILFLISAGAFLISYFSYKERGFLFNNAFLFASKQERKSMNKKQSELANITKGGPICDIYRVIIMAVAQCAAPLGQAIYGFAFEQFMTMVYFCLQKNSPYGRENSLFRYQCVRRYAANFTRQHSSNKCCSKYDYHK